MSSNPKSAAKAAPFTFTCPHLGMLDDTTTTTNFPSEINHCLHCKPACVPSRQQQRDYCLSQNYNNCSIINKPAPARLPISRRWERDPAEFRAIFIKTALAVFGAGLLAMFFIFGAPARISEMIQAFVPDATREAYQPHDFSTRTPTARVETPFATATLFFSDIQLPTALPASQIVKLTVVELEMGAYCRSGPDTSFRGVTILKSGDIVQALARDSTDRFFLVRVPKQLVEDCWVSQEFVIAQGDAGTLPQYTPMPTPRPTATPTPTITETAEPAAPTAKPQNPPPADTPVVIPTEPPATEPSEPPSG